MAILKAKLRKSYSDDKALGTVMYYISHPKDNSHITLGYYGVTDICNAVKQIQSVEAVYGKTEGRHLRHFILSFSYMETVDFELIYEITREVAAFYANRYQIVYAVHHKVENPHAHIVMSTVDYNTGVKFTDEYGELKAFKQYVAEVLCKYGFSLEEFEIEAE